MVESTSQAIRTRAARWLILTICALPIGAPRPLLAASAEGVLTVTAKDDKTGEAIPARLELRDGRGRPVKLRPEAAVVAGDSLYFDGSTTLSLRPGEYAFLAEAGPEFTTRPGKFTVGRQAEGAAEFPLTRRVDMHREGWWAGDLDVGLGLAELPLIMRARHVDFVPVTTVVNDQGRCRQQKQPARGGDPNAATSTEGLQFGSWAALDNRRGGFLAIGAEKLPDVCHWKAADSTVGSITAAKEAGACVVALTPFAWDFPLWVAAGKLDAVAIINRHSQLGGVIDNEAEGRPRDKALFPDKLGNGRYSETIYHHLLNCGLRLPPAAGSGAGAASGGRTINSPLGTNRVYVHCGESFNRDAWLEGLRAGRVMVTNGPLLRTKVEGQPPGNVFKLEAGESHEFQIELELAFYEKTQVEYLEIVQNGKAIHQIRLDQLSIKRGKLPPVPFDSSGWFLVRAVTNNPDVYQYASTGPYYVESNYQPRVSRESVRYFLDWLDESAQKFADNAAVAADIQAARPFWTGLFERANAD